MYMAKIYGYTEVMAFSEDKEKAKKLAIKEKKSFAKDDLKKWSWDTVSEYYGATVIKIKEGTTIQD